MYACTNTYRVLHIFFKQVYSHNLFFLSKTQQHWYRVKHCGKRLQKCRLIVQHTLHGKRKKGILSYVTTCNILKGQKVHKQKSSGLVFKTFYYIWFLLIKRSVLQKNLWATGNNFLPLGDWKHLLLLSQASVSGTLDFKVMNLWALCSVY